MKNEATKLRDSLRRLLVSTGTLVDNRRPCGARLSQTSAYALLELADGGEMRVSELAKKLAIDRTNVSRLCLRMEKNGELKFSSHPTDGRVKMIELTEEGKRLARNVDISSSKHFSKVVTILGDSTQPVIDAIRLLENAMILKRNDTNDE